jgi:hypothetical protein
MTTRTVRNRRSLAPRTLPAELQRALHVGERLDRQALAGEHVGDARRVGGATRLGTRGMDTAAARISTLVRAA